MIWDSIKEKLNIKERAILRFQRIPNKDTLKSANTSSQNNKGNFGNFATHLASTPQENSTFYK
jgi:hypothetical protein